MHSGSIVHERNEQHAPIVTNLSMDVSAGSPEKKKEVAEGMNLIC